MNNAPFTPTFLRERLILRATLEALLATGYAVKIDDGMETSPELRNPQEGIEWVLWRDTANNRVLWNLDDWHVLAERQGTDHGFVWFIVSNGNGGRDVISDYSCSLSEYVEPIIDGPLCNDL